jgi:epoxyqueuosine reductase
LIERAHAAGFQSVRITRPDSIASAGSRLVQFIDSGYHGDMSWLAERAHLRSDPLALWPQVRSVIMLGMSYAPDGDPLEDIASADRGVISCYARGKDYHDIVKAALKHIARWLAEASSLPLKVFVDTAPVMEKPLAAAAGVGWQGKHTNLVSRDHGSWLFLGSIFTAAEFDPDAAEDDHCGSCRRCLDACPTDAFPAPYRLDPRRCISYLTIEHKGHIAEEFRQPMGNRIYGCDDCLAVCPWNKFAQASAEARFSARAETDNPPLADLLGMDDRSFRQRFAGTPIKRTGRDRFLRNVLIAAGNSGDAALVPRVEPRLFDSSPLVRAMAVWAISRLCSREEARAPLALQAEHEADPAVRAEIAAALKP